MHPEDLLTLRTRRYKLLDLDLQDQVHLFQSIIEEFALGQLYPEVTQLVDVLESRSNKQIKPRILEKNPLLILFLANKHALCDAQRCKNALLLRLKEFIEPILQNPIRLFALDISQGKPLILAE